MDSHQPQKITEQPSAYRHLEQMSVPELIRHINEEDHRVAPAVKAALPQIEKLVLAAEQRLKQGGRMFYLGAGTSGRLGVLDASECPPTYGVPEGLVTGLIAGGDAALRKGIEQAEDDPDGGWRDLQANRVSPADIVIGIAASGTTPYVWGALKHCRSHGVTTGCIVCNPGSIVARYADYPVEVITGPEFVTGSTRMKAGTAQKMVLNILSTSVMIRLGRVKDNRMVHMQAINEKLMDRGARIIMEEGVVAGYEQARELLKQFGSVRLVLDHLQEQRPNPQS